MALTPEELAARSLGCVLKRWHEPSLMLVHQLARRLVRVGLPCGRFLDQTVNVVELPDSLQTTARHSREHSLLTASPSRMASLGSRLVSLNFRSGLVLARLKYSPTP